MATQRPNGKWRAQVFLGTDENGKRLYKSFEADTADEADFLALSFKLGKGKRVDQSAITLRAAIRAHIDTTRGILSPATTKGYEVIERNFGDFLDTPIQKITRMSLQLAINDYMFRGRNDGRPGQRSAKSVRNAYGLICTALKHNGISLGEISLPRVEDIDYATPFDKDLEKIFAAVKDTSIELPVLLICFCSLRRSEICGLRYSDVNFEDGSIKVERAKLHIDGKDYVKTTKTKKSKRTVFATDYILNLIREKQKKDGGEYIVTITPNAIGKRFAKILKENNIAKCKFHELRHSFVSVLSKHGIDPLYIQTTGGWSSDRIMRKVYLQTSADYLQNKSKQANFIFESLMQPDATKTKA